MRCLGTSTPWGKQLLCGRDELQGLSVVNTICGLFMHACPSKPLCSATSTCSCRCVPYNRILSVGFVVFAGSCRYQGSYAQRSGGRSDGCATFW
jgi:hypothetical protein